MYVEDKWFEIAADLLLGYDDVDYHVSENCETWMKGTLLVQNNGKIEIAKTNSCLNFWERGLNKKCFVQSLGNRQILIALTPCAKTNEIGIMGKTGVFSSGIFFVMLNYYPSPLLC